MVLHSPDKHGKEQDNSLPSAFMKGRRPHLYPDTRAESTPAISREVLDHHLNTLTNRKQENQFEYFAKRLAEKELCPNLRPQTGPTGGGDAKVDSETYPVSDEISQRWFLGDPSAGKEEWGFAFSAKKDWKSKARLDIANILTTGRTFNYIYFVTNQYAPDKARSKLEIELSTKANTPVKILDRTWIIDRVFNHDRIALTIEALGLTDTKLNDSETVGPLDAERLAELTALDSQIDDSDRYQGTPYALAQDCFRTAMLARGLGHVRRDVDGRFERAIRIAKSAGFKQQELRFTYNHAWTSYFWYDDFAFFNDLYNKVEELALNSENASDLEMLSTLYSLVRSAESHKYLSKEEANIEARGSLLVTTLEKIASITVRPNNSLEARTNLLIIKIADAAYRNEPGQLEEVWKQFRKILRDAVGLGTFSFERIFSVVSEIGQYVPESEAFDRFFEEIVAVLETRKSEGAGGKAYLERAFQKAEKGLNYDAIRYFGRAADRLIKEEYSRDLALALVGASYAYEHVGLVWAARTYALAAASHSLAAFEENGDVGSYVWLPLERLIWLEAKIGRVPQFLASYELKFVLQSQFAVDHEKKLKLDDDQISTGMILGLLFLDTKSDDLPVITRFPDVLDRLGLPMARVALLEVLGHETTMRLEGTIPSNEDKLQVREFFDDWRKKRSKYEVATNPDFLIGERVKLRSVVIGCELTLTASNNPTAIALGESFLGAIESLFSTSLDQRVFPRMQQIEIRLVSTTTHTGPPILTFLTTQGLTRAEIAHGLQLGFHSLNELKGYSDWLSSAVLEFALKIFSIFNEDEWVRQVFEVERGFSRAITFSNVPLMTRNVFGDAPKFSLAQWQLPEDKDYPAQPTERRSSGTPSSTKRRPQPKFGKGLPPADLVDTNKLKHSDYRVNSIIDATQWDAAGWRGILFQHTDDVERYPPFLALMFKEEVPARAIFEGLRARVGEIDSNSTLRITIIRGISASHPNHYAAIVGSNLNTSDSGNEGKILSFVSRIHHMTPNSTLNLDRFQEVYTRSGRYFLAPAILHADNETPELLIDLRIGLHELHFREAWTIEENDPDVMALSVDDPPVIPTDQPNAPVIKALELLRRIQERNPDTNS